MNLISQVDSASSLYKKYKESWEANQFEESKEHLVRLVNKNYTVSKSYYGFIHNNLGRIYWKLGEIDSAEFHYTEAMVYCSGDDESTQYLLNSIYNNIALLYDQRSQYEVAIEFYQKSINTLARITSRGSKYYARISAGYLNYSISNYNYGNFSEALKKLKLAKEFKVEYKLPYLGSVYYNLARTNQAVNNYSESEYYYKQGINQWTIEYGINTYHLAGIYLNYGKFLIEKGKLHLGLIYYNKALHNYLTNYGQKHPYTSNCYDQLAKFSIKQENYTEALKYIQQAIISICPQFNESNIFSNPVTYKPLLDIDLLNNYRTKVQALKELPKTNTDSISVEKKNYSKNDIIKFTLETIELEIDLLHKIQDSYMDQESRLYLAENQKEIFIDGIEIANRLHNLTKDPNYLSQSYRIASQGKSLEFQFELEEKQRLYLESMEDPLADSIFDLKKEIFSYQNMIHLEQQRLDPDSVMILMWRDTLFSLKRNYENSVAQLWGDKNNPGNKKFIIASDHLEATQQKLRRNETLIEYAISNSSIGDYREMFTFVITKKDCHVLNTKLDSTFFRNLKIVNQQLSEFDLSGSPTLINDSLNRSLNHLYHILISPIDKWFSGKQLIIIPDEELTLLPFDALIRGNIKDLNTQSIDQHYLLKDYYISYAINSQFFKKRKSTIFHSPDVLAIGETSLIKDDDSIIKLNAIEEEFNAIFKEYKGQQITQDIGKVELLNMIEGNKILHFAMHSYSEDHALSSAYIQLDPVDDSIYSNRLFDYEISSIRLSSPMVVLSSCESGSGTLYSGEGVMSLSRSFLLAGSESVVHTLWPVEDKSSSQIMIDYYNGLKKGWNKSKALQKAKIKYLENASPTFYNPHFWAGFQVTGNIQRISTSPIIIIGCVAGGVLFAFCILFWIIRKRKN